jgi:hypothetical protein
VPARRRAALTLATPATPWSNAWALGVAEALFIAHVVVLVAVTAGSRAAALLAIVAVVLRGVPAVLGRVRHVPTVVTCILLAYVVYSVLVHWNRSVYHGRLERLLTTSAWRRHPAWNMLGGARERCDDIWRELGAPRVTEPVRWVSFAAGGFKSLSYIGAVFYLLDAGALRLSTCTRRTRFLGASLGGYFAVALATGRLESAESAMICLIWAALALDDDPLALVGAYSSILRRGVRAILRRGDARILTGGAYLSVTTFDHRWITERAPSNVLVSKYTSVEDIVHVVSSSMHIPFISDTALLHSVRGRYTIDGAFSCRQPLPPNGESCVVINGLPNTACRTLLVPPPRGAIIDEICNGYRAAHDALLRHLS